MYLSQHLAATSKVNHVHGTAVNLQVNSKLVFSLVKHFKPIHKYFSICLATSTLYNVGYIVDGTRYRGFKLFLKLLAVCRHCTEQHKSNFVFAVGAKHCNCKTKPSYYTKLNKKWSLLSVQVCEGKCCIHCTCNILSCTQSLNQTRRILVCSL